MSFNLRAAVRAVDEDTDLSTRVAAPGRAA
jgi:hypothetical protein